MKYARKSSLKIFGNRLPSSQIKAILYIQKCITLREENTPSNRSKSVDFVKT